MKKTLFVIALGLTGILFSCDEESPKPCTEERTTASIIGEFPDSLQVGDTYDLSVQYVLDNSCGSFDRFDVSLTDQSFEVKMITKYEGCSCNLELSEETVEYEIDIDFPGTYEYRFWQADSDFDTRTLVIYQ